MKHESVERAKVQIAIIEYFETFIKSEVWSDFISDYILRRLVPSKGARERRDPLPSWSEAEAQAKGFKAVRVGEANRELRAVAITKMFDFLNAFGYRAGIPEHPETLLKWAEKEA